MHFVIVGAGSVGCFVGGMLAQVGNRVTLHGRPAMAQRLAGGMRLTRHDGLDLRIGAERFEFRASGPVAPGDVFLVCVKSRDTADAAGQIAFAVRPDTPVVSLQNGVENNRTLRDALPGANVLAGVVGFNVAQMGDDRFHCGTDGDILLEDGPGVLRIAASLIAAKIDAEVRRDIVAVQWGKLLLNLNNAVNALSGLPLKQELSDRAYRKALAFSIGEALGVLKAAGLRPAKVGAAPPGLLAPILRLPDPVFRFVAGGMLKIDEKARSSMAEDLERGREPEIDELNGAICELGRRHGVATPVNQAIVALVREAHAAGGTPAMSGEELLRRIGG
jgi:2-dehydropantoate 2-reductase